jgi:diguanylate cyclase
MTAQERSLYSPRSGILGWLGLVRAPSAEPQPFAPTAVASPPDVVATVRQALVEDIGRFLAVHDLDVSSFTLAVAHDYLTGEDVGLARLIDRQVQIQSPITIGWLEDVLSGTSRADDRQALSTLMTKLEFNLEEFGVTTTAAKSAATDYSTALEIHVGEIHVGEIHVGEIQGNQTTGAVISELAMLAKAMLNRTRALELEMSRSELHAKTLRHNLHQARHIAEVDHLTGLPNRRAFEARLASEYVAAQEADERLCVAFCDIDHFKAINDTHGHEAGDRILKAVAQNLARISGDHCHVARHGGEEFVVLFRGAMVNECWDLLDDVRAQQAERRLVNRATDVPFGKVTFSAGIADIFAFPDARAALRAADQALYRAKHEGRNRIVVARLVSEAETGIAA